MARANGPRGGLGTVGALMIVALLLGVGVMATHAEQISLSAEEQTTWRRHLLPLPQQIELEGAVVVPASSVEIVVSDDAPELIQCAAEELAAVFERATGQAASIATGEPTSECALMLRVADVPALTELKNADQAYTIRPLDGRPGLVLEGLTPTGVYYASKTVQQLLAPSFEQRDGTWSVRVPVVTITDWPELEERGEWGGSIIRDIEWCAARKMNVAEVHAGLSIDDNGVGRASLKPELMERGRRHAFRIVPIIHHLEQLENTGMFERYPELAGKDTKGSICFAQPRIVTLVAEWFAALGQIEGVEEVMVWLSEEGKGCQCESCLARGRFEGETETLLAAWRQARRTCPDLGLRILLTQASYKFNDKVLPLIPDGVKVSYYDGGRTYDSSRRPMIYPLLEDYVKQGRWLGVYPQLTYSWRLVTPFSGAEFIHTRMNEFVQKGLACLIGYATPDNRYYDFNVEAACDWSWNPSGRTPHEFAAAWGLRHGARDPEIVAQWSDTIGPVGWDCAGSRHIFYDVYGSTAKRLRDGFECPFGRSIYGEFESEEQFQRDIELCEKARPLAERSGLAILVHETDVLRAYVKMLEATYYLSKLYRGEKAGLPEEHREEAGKLLASLVRASDEAANALGRWGLAVDPGAQPPSRFRDTLKAVVKIGDDINVLAEELGFEPTPRHLKVNLKPVGAWKSEDWKGQDGATLVFDVTERIAGPGEYAVTFVWTKGAYGLQGRAVTLASHAKGQPEELKIEAIDEHDCHAGAWVKGNVYRIKLEQYDPQRVYQVQCKVAGNDTNGDIYFRQAQ